MEGPKHRNARWKREKKRKRLHFSFFFRRPQTNRTLSRDRQCNMPMKRPFTSTSIWDVRWFSFLVSSFSLTQPNNKNLDQRLRDAKITQEKKEKVMNTIWGRFISEDEFYRLNEVDFKSQFSRIAQSSIMKLNESSMSKLYDLMLMGLKYQCFHSHHPDELYLVLLNHFSGIYDIYREISANTAREIKIFFHQQINPRFLKLSTYQWLRLRRRVLNDYQVRFS